MFNSVTSGRDALSVVGGGVAVDSCECMSNVIRSNKNECGEFFFET